MMLSEQEISRIKEIVNKEFDREVSEIKKEFDRKIKDIEKDKIYALACAVVKNKGVPSHKLSDFVFVARQTAVKWKSKNEEKFEKLYDVILKKMIQENSVFFLNLKRKNEIKDANK